MRLAGPQERLDCLPITAVPLNLNCRDEIIPILASLAAPVWSGAVTTAIVAAGG